MNQKPTTKGKKMNPFETLIEHCNESHPHMESPRGQIDIAKAKAEHAALLAVAEAAKVCCEVLPSQLAIVSSGAVNKLGQSLATLAQTQKGE